MMVAALFVQPRGCYANLPDVDPWDEARDARKYAGPQTLSLRTRRARDGVSWPP